VAPRAASYFDLMEACLFVLKADEAAGRGGEVAPVYRPSGIERIRVEQVLLHLRRLLDEDPEKVGLLEAFLPPPGKEARARPEIARTAVAATFVAALELCRSGELQLEQEIAFGAINITRAPRV